MVGREVREGELRVISHIFTYLVRRQESQDDIITTEEIVMTHHNIIIEWN